MSFQSGTITFSRFRVLRSNAKSPTEEILEAIKEHALVVDPDVTPEDVEYGWCGGRHVLDNDLSFENNVFGDAIIFGLRIDNNRAPSSIRKAYLDIEIAAAAKGNPSGFASKRQKAEAKQEVDKKIREEMKEGKYRRSKVVPVLWDIARGCVYSPATGTSRAQLQEIFSRTFQGELELPSAGFAAERNQIDVSVLKPTSFATALPAGTEVTYPWSSKTTSTADYLGNEFVIWMMHEIMTCNGSIITQDMTGPYSQIDVLIDRSLVLECAVGESGRDSIAATGPDRLPEVIEAIRHGKVPRKVGLTVSVAGSEFSLLLNPESFSFGGVKLPEVEGDTNRVVTEERINLLDTLCTGMEKLYVAFLADRENSEKWGNVTTAITEWLSGESHPSNDSEESDEEATIDDEA